MRFDVEVHWNPDGLLEGEVRPSGAATATPFWGITELVGLLQAQLGPARSVGSRNCPDVKFAATPARIGPDWPGER